jgi:hypothetical protein
MSKKKFSLSKSIFSHYEAEETSLKKENQLWKAVLKDMENFKMKLVHSEVEKLRDMIYKYYGKITDIFLSEIGLQGK